MAFEIIIGVGTLCFLLLYLVFKLSAEHKYLQLLIIGVVIFLMLLIPKSTIDDKDYCQILVSNVTTTGTTDHLEYSRVCFTNSYNTSNSFYKTMVWLAALIMIYLFGYFVAWKVALEPLLKIGQRKDYDRKK